MLLASLPQAPGWEEHPQPPVHPPPHLHPILLQRAWRSPQRRAAPGWMRVRGAIRSRAHGPALCSLLAETHPANACLAGLTDHTIYCTNKKTQLHARTCTPTGHLALKHRFRGGSRARAHLMYSPGVSASCPSGPRPDCGLTWGMAISTDTGASSRGPAFTQLLPARRGLCRSSWQRFSDMISEGCLVSELHREGRDLCVTKEGHGLRTRRCVTRVEAVFWLIHSCSEHSESSSPCPFFHFPGSLLNQVCPHQCEGA